MIVAADGSGDFQTVQAAIDSVPQNNCKQVQIQVKNGVYREKIRVTSPWISLIGENPLRTLIAFDDAAKKPLPGGEPMNTFNSYTIYIGGHDFTAEGLTFENSAGDGRIVGQAVAVYADADRITFKNCRLLGHQDTLFTGPLPKNPVPKGLNLVHPALGSGDAGYTGEIRQYYRDCFIRGDIDFIFGSATAVFDHCEIFSNNRGEPVNGYITAGSTSLRQEFGYVFTDCRLTGAAGPHTVYLGRPWRDFAKAAFINCSMGEHIIPAGWDNWDLPEREKTVNYCEFGSTGPGAAQADRVKWSKQLTAEQVKKYAALNVLSGSDGWEPDKDADCLKA